MGSFVSLGVLALGFGYAWGQFHKGENLKTIEDFQLFNTQIEALTKVCNEQAGQIKTLQDDIKKHTQEIGRLNGINEEKDKKIKELNDILANRDPALTEFIKLATKSLEALLSGVEDIKKVIIK